jgi:hypothetical protein
LWFDAPDKDVDTLSGAAALRALPLNVIPINDPSIIDFYERKFVLVRPDSHVAWRGGSVPDDPLKEIDTIRGAA